MKNFKRIFKRTEGAAAIEFAIVAVPLLLLIMGTLEFGFVMYATNVLEGATDSAARLGITGSNYDSGMSRDAFVRSTIKRKSSGIMDPSKIRISTQIFSSIGGASGSTPVLGGGFGGSGDGVLYRVEYDWPLFTPLISNIIGNGDGTITLRSSVLVQNEPY